MILFLGLMISDPEIPNMRLFQDSGMGNPEKKWDKTRKNEGGETHFQKRRIFAGLPYGMILA